MMPKIWRGMKNLQPISRLNPNTQAFREIEIGEQMWDDLTFLSTNAT